MARWRDRRVERRTGGEGDPEGPGDPPVVLGGGFLGAGAACGDPPEAPPGTSSPSSNARTRIGRVAFSQPTGPACARGEVTGSGGGNAEARGRCIERSHDRTIKTTTPASPLLQPPTIPGLWHGTGSAVAGASCSSRPPASTRSLTHDTALVRLLPLLGWRRW